MSLRELTEQAGEVSRWTYKWTLVCSHMTKELWPLTSVAVSPEWSGLDQWPLASQSFYPPPVSYSHHLPTLGSISQAKDALQINTACLWDSPCQQPLVRAPLKSSFFTIKSFHFPACMWVSANWSNGGWFPCYSKVWLNSLCLFSFVFCLFPQWIKKKWGHNKVIQS